MADKRCFVQFSHPGKEHDAHSGRVWHKEPPSHRRKFMQLQGHWIERDGTSQSGTMWAWGEWEPESNIVREFTASGGNSRYPCFLWQPYYIPKTNLECADKKLHNTDPFVLGNRFLYSNCGQGSQSKRGLKELAQGSVIAFGSGKEIDGKRKWTLDTVLVVKDSVEYSPRNARTELRDWAPDTFLEVCGGPFSRSDASWRLRLYRGATPDDPVEGMFSFFPAMPAGGETGFPRPPISLPDCYFNPGSWQAPKGLRCQRSYDKLHGLWECLVGQVRDAGLVLGTYAELPKGRVNETLVSLVP